MGCGMFITSRPSALSAAFQVSASYMPSNVPSLDPYVTSAQWSRRFLGLRLFLALASAGWVGYGQHVEHAIELAALLRERLAALGWRTVNESSLAVTCIEPPGGTGEVRDDRRPGPRLGPRLDLRGIVRGARRHPGLRDAWRDNTGRHRGARGRPAGRGVRAREAGEAPLKAWARALAMTAPIARNPSTTLPTLMDDLADRFGTAPALLSDDACLTFRGLAERVNQYARWAVAQGFAPGDTVCLVMPNCPDYMAIWLGLARAGVVTALVNINLTGASLAHSIRITSPRGVVAGAGCAGAVATVLPQLAPDLRCWVHGGDGHGFPRLDHEAMQLAGDRLRGSECPAPTIADRALCIYTSGTTGLPKAANVSHRRLMQWSHWFAGMMDTGPGDRMYNCLPMYHSVGGVVATGAALVGGGSVVLRERFSAAEFWSDVARWECTLFQYVGELCRYLLNSPPHPLERAHRLRLCCGNGLRPEVWEGFKERFRIPQILEFYAATEGSFSLCNAEGEPGAIGRIPSFLAHRFPVALVRLDVALGQPVRDEDGLCVRCSPGEVGEAIGKIASEPSLGDSGPDGRFEGYTDAAASEGKILRNVFAPGDAWFRTGDLMRRDGRGYFYFVDRIGDAFRWKGENVSAAEVAEAAAGCRGVAEAVAYGVLVPGTEGRAGMAAIVPGPGFDLAELREHLAGRLPGYARPLFVRVCERIEATATFKPKTQELAREGYDPGCIGDALYFDDRSRQAFVRLDAGLHARIQAGSLLL